MALLTYLIVVTTESYRAHKRVKYADGKSSTTSERLRHVEFSVWIVIVVLVQELHVRVVT